MKRNLWIGILVGMLALTVGGCAPGRQAAFAPEALMPVATVAVELPPAEEEARMVSLSSAGADMAAVASATTTERLVIHTADLDLIVPDTEQAIEQIQDLAEELGGYVVSLNTYQYQEGLQGSVTLRVPAESFDTALQRLKDMATTVRRESLSGQDVTEEYVDLESRLRHLRAKEEQLLEFLDRAEDTEAVLAVYEQLSYTQQEIEQVTGRMQYLENQAALATITVDLIPDALAQPLEVGGWNLPGTIRNAVETLLDVLEFSVKAVIYLVIVILPTLLIIALPIVGLVFLIRWLVRRRRR
ncbi:MAG TPA: DUF4349 domain-containing protein [Anaerolineales bacterium]|nr:DUF4349 domain-containing protein [Anaerolineae bacterium]HIQ02426.1 DUF4349 domain-containing protein [Anaerolineales bacterium]